MHCNNLLPGVWPEGFGGAPGWGWNLTAQYYGYNNFFNSYDSTTDKSWEETIKPMIDHLNPIMVCFLSGVPPPVSSFHWNALKGYEEDYSDDYIWTNDPWNIERVLNWDVYQDYRWLTTIETLGNSHCRYGNNRGG